MPDGHSFLTQNASGGPLLIDGRRIFLFSVARASEKGGIPC